MNNLCKMSVIFLLCLCLLPFSYAARCSFDATKDCVLQRNILVDRTTTGLKYYAPTNYDHRMSGEINVYDSTMVGTYSEATNYPGQIKLSGKIVNGLWRTGEIMTRANLNQPPYNAPGPSAPWTTKEASHGYIEVEGRMPRCESSDDGLCQNNTNPVSYNNGLWPAIWMMPTDDAVWPTNGEIDIAEAYQINTCFNVATAVLHFPGTSPSCTNGDCVGAGYPMGTAVTPGFLFSNYHKWGFEWQPDPTSTTGGVLITGYFDNIKIYGPVRSDALPADGPNALRRGFNDPNGGYYLIVNLAIGGPYAGAPNPHLQSAGMYIQSIKSFTVSGGSTPPPTNTCLPPANIQSMYSADKKQATIAWQIPANSKAIANFQVNNYQNTLIWKGANKDARCFIDGTLPGKAGKFSYFLYSNCTDGTQSVGKQYDVVIPLAMLKKFHC